jgi:DNA-binding SARP family transcriptional activator
MSAAKVKEHADSLAEEGRLDEAIEEYRSLIEIDPADPCSHFGLCDAYHKKGICSPKAYPRHLIVVKE